MRVCGGYKALTRERCEINGYDAGEKQKWNLMSYLKKDGRRRHHQIIGWFGLV